MKTYNVALLPADGIGPEVIDAGWDVMKAAASKFGFGLKSENFDWSCDYLGRTFARANLVNPDVLQRHSG